MSRGGVPRQTLIRNQSLHREEEGQRQAGSCCSSCSGAPGTASQVGVTGVTCAAYLRSACCQRGCPTHRHCNSVHSSDKVSSPKFFCLKSAVCFVMFSSVFIGRKERTRKCKHKESLTNQEALMIRHVFCTLYCGTGHWVRHQLTCCVEGKAQWTQYHCTWYMHR